MAFNEYGKALDEGGATLPTSGALPDTRYWVQITKGVEDTNVIICTLTAMENQDPLVEDVHVELWTSATAGGAVAAVDDIAITTGTVFQILTAEGHNVVISAGGVVVAALTETSPTASKFINARVVGSPKITSLEMAFD